MSGRLGLLSPLRAGAIYFALVFALGFVLGTLRVTLIGPAVGELLAIGLELPVMLAASWLACGWTLKKFPVSAARRPRVLMGATAFMLLMVAEAALSVSAFGRTLAEHLATYRLPAAQLGLLAQVVFALFPLVRK